MQNIISTGSQYKIIIEMFHVLFCTKSSKAGMHFTRVVDLSSDYPCFECLGGRPGGIPGLVETVLDRATVTCSSLIQAGAYDSVSIRTPRCYWSAVATWGRRAADCQPLKKTHWDGPVHGAREAPKAL